MFNLKLGLKEINVVYMSKLSIDVTKKSLKTSKKLNGKKPLKGLC